MAHPRFLKFNDKGGNPRFHLTATNGQIILASEGYSSTEGRDNGIESVKTHAPDDGNYDRKESKDGQYYFNLKASNGRIIGTSEMYTTCLLYTSPSPRDA